MSENLRSKNLNSTIESQENTLSGYLAPRNETLLSEVINNVYFPYNKKMVTGLENLSVQGKGDTPQRGNSLGEPLLGDTSQSLASQDTLFGLISQSTLIKGSHTIGHKYMEDPLSVSSPSIMQEDNGQQDAMADGLSASPRRGGVPQQSRGFPLKQDPLGGSPAERDPSLHFSGVTPLSAMLKDPAPRGKSSEPAMQRGLGDPRSGSPWDKNIQTLKKNVYFFSKSLLDSKYLINI